MIGEDEFFEIVTAAECRTIRLDDDCSNIFIISIDITITIAMITMLLFQSHQGGFKILEERKVEGIPLSRSIECEREHPVLLRLDQWLLITIIFLVVGIGRRSTIRKVSLDCTVCAPPSIAVPVGSDFVLVHADTRIDEFRAIGIGVDIVIGFDSSTSRDCDGSWKYTHV
jgi:hypothetical protein